MIESLFKMNNELFQIYCYVSVIGQILEFNKSIDFKDNTQYIDIKNYQMNYLHNIN